MFARHQDEDLREKWTEKLDDFLAESSADFTDVLLKGVRTGNFGKIWRGGGDAGGGGGGVGGGDEPNNVEGETADANGWDGRGDAEEEEHYQEEQQEEEEREYEEEDDDEDEDDGRSRRSRRRAREGGWRYLSGFSSCFRLGGRR